MDKRLERTWWFLKVTFGVVPVVAGLDKFTNLLADWPAYLSPMVANLVPAAGFMKAVGVVEIVAGVLVLTKLTRYASLIVAAWLIGIALNLLTTGHFFDVAVRDLVMALGAWALHQLTVVREATLPKEAARTAVTPAAAH